MSDVGEGRSETETLRESAELFRVLAETSHDLIRLIDTGGNVVYVSPSVITFLGKRPQRLFDNIHPDDLEHAHAWWARVFAGSSDRLDWRIQAGDGSWHWLESWGTLVRYQGSQHLLMLCRDISERVQTIQDLRESQRKLEEAQRIGHIGYWDNDLVANQINWSAETYRILGLDPGSVVPTLTTLKERIHPDDLERQIEVSRKARIGDGRYDLEYRIVRPNGEVRRIRSVGDVVRDGNGNPIRAFGVVQDITDAYEAEQALRANNSLLNAVVEGTSDALFVKNTQGQYLLINSAGASFLAKSVDQVIGRTDPELFEPAVADFIVDRDRQVIETGKSQTFEEEHRVEGVLRTYVVTKSVYRDWEGKVLGLVGISSDVTDLKRLEKQFREAQKMEAIGRLAGGIAHDFNNLLTVINSYSEMMLTELTADHPDREPLSEIRNAGERAANLTHQLLAFSRNQILLPRVVDLNSTIPDLIKLLARLIGTDIDLSFVAGKDLALTKVDPMQLDQAIINLAVNARDAMPSGGRLTIETRNVKIENTERNVGPDIYPGSYVLISVTDSGQGMDEATKARIFEPFFTTKEVGKGTGLGLAMVYGFVKQSGGHIEMDSMPGKGTTFRIFLPRSSEQDTGSVTERKRKNPVGTETVLLVEDEPAVRALTKRVLESSGYTVVDAPDGQTGLAIAQNHKGKIHILVTDLIMPVMNGSDLAEEISRTRPETRVLFMSGHIDADLLPKSVTTSQRMFLQKPFTTSELARKVRDVLDGPHDSIEPS